MMSEKNLQIQSKVVKVEIVLTYDTPKRRATIPEYGLSRVSGSLKLRGELFFNFSKEQIKFFCPTGFLDRNTPANRIHEVQTLR